MNGKKLSIRPVSESHSIMSDPLRPHGLYRLWNFPGQNTGVGSLSLLQGIFPTQGSNPGLTHWKWILYQLSHKGSPRILEWVACPFSSGSPQPRNWTGVSCIAGGFFTNWAEREANFIIKNKSKAIQEYDQYWSQSIQEYDLCTETISTEEQINFVPCWTSEFQTHIFSSPMTPLSSVIIIGPWLDLFLFICMFVLIKLWMHWYK